MKIFTSIPIIFILFFFISANAENYYVVKVEGEVKLKEIPLKTGDKLSDQDAIAFTSAKDKIYLLSPSNGYFLLSPAKHGEDSKKWLVSLKYAIIPQNKYYNTANRGGSSSLSSFDDIYDLSGFFRDKVLIVENTRFTFNAANIPLNKDNYFEFTPHSKKDKIIFSYDENSFSMSGNFDNDRIEMNYIQNGNSKKIGTFSLWIKSREEIANELNVLFANQNPNSSTRIYYEQVIPFISDAYGNTNLETIKSILINDLKIDLKVKD